MNYELDYRKQQTKALSLCHSLCLSTHGLIRGWMACGMEFKDRAYGGKWDWLDLLATILGGVLGQMLQILLIYALKCVS
jgi:hypothetical protein